MTASRRPVREYLFASALREAFAEGYRGPQLRADIVAGITLGIVAIPLAMALAIATGVPPQHGLYAAIVGGLVIAVAGGSRFNISGPTAAFVAILLPIVGAHGIGGLLVATVMAGIILVAIGMSRLGRLVEFIPYPVIIGFTAGIGVVIATLQLKDFFGLEVVLIQPHFVDKVMALLGALPSLRWESVAVAAAALFTMLAWPRLKTPVPAHLMALVVGTLFALGCAQLFPGFRVDTIGSEFSWSMNGESGTGIPPFLPAFVFPWELPGADGNPVGLSFHLVRELLPAAFAIALLCAIESLLCAVVADGFTGKRHNPNGELVGQGLGNIFAPFFGGITCTAAIARTAANVRVGATSPVSGAVHALMVLAALLLLAPLLSEVPMAALAALLLVVAWNMAEPQHVVHMIRISPRADVVVLLTCFVLTVVFDMVLAVGVGMVLAAALFIRRMGELTGARLVAPQQHEHLAKLPPGVVVYDVNGPLFFGAARQALENLGYAGGDTRAVVMDMSDVTVIDMTGLVAFTALRDRLRQRGVLLVVCCAPIRIRAKLERAGVVAEPGVLQFAGGYDEALALCRST
ncbi:MAG: C4-dicarboxylic acid transporter DauA [Gammaproteobacteria bacterium]